MRISGLIIKLQAVMSESGDLDVMTDSGSGRTLLPLEHIFEEHLLIDSDCERVQYWQNHNDVSHKGKKVCVL